MDIEDFLRTKYDIKSISHTGGTCIILSRVGSDSSCIILPSVIEHFYDMGDMKYLVGNAKKLYELTKHDRNLRGYEWDKENRRLMKSSS